MSIKYRVLTELTAQDLEVRLNDFSNAGYEIRDVFQHFPDSGIINDQRFTIIAVLKPKPIDDRTLQVG